MWGGVKAICVWPTNPQLYVKGELVGGCDIILEMQVRAFVWVVVDVGWCESYLRLAYKPSAVRQGGARGGCDIILEMQMRTFVWVVVDTGWCESYLRLAYKPTAVRCGGASGFAMLFWKCRSVYLY